MAMVSPSTATSEPNLSSPILLAKSSTCNFWLKDNDARPSLITPTSETTFSVVPAGSPSMKKLTRRADASATTATCCHLF